MADYYNVTTNLGDAEIAASIASNTKLAITHIAFGDGNGSVPTPQKNRTTLVREVHRQAVTKYERHPTNANWIIIETIIPSNIGGFWVREMGVIANGKLISHGSHAPFEKVADSTGVSEYRLKFTLNVRDGNVVNITLDQSLIYASQAWVEENYVKRINIRKNFGETYAQDVVKNYDFNNIMPGDYIFHDASVATLNAPPFDYASVYCEGTYADNAQRLVIAREYRTGKLAIRGRQNTSWSEWSLIATTASDITGNAASASKLQTARTVQFSGAATGSFGYDGSGNSSCILTLANSGVAASSYGSNLKIPIITVNQKGLLTGVSEQLIPIVDDLSTGGSNKLLSAEQGKNLQNQKLGKNESAISADKLFAMDDRTLKPSSVPPYSIKSYFVTEYGLNNAVDSVNYGDFLAINTYHDASGGKVNGLFFDKFSKRILHYQAGFGATVWGAAHELAYTDSNISGNAASASKLQNARNIAISGDGTGNNNFDGTSNTAINFTLNNVNNSAGVWGANNLEIPTFTLNNKGLITSAGNRPFPLANIGQYGATILYDGLDSTSNNHAATANAVRQLNEAKPERNQVKNEFGRITCPLVSNGYDYNNIMPGDYLFHDASQGTLNAPPFAYASIYCEATYADNAQRFVTAREYGTGKLAVRGRQNTSWSEWSLIATTASDITGNAASASKLQTARTVQFSGAATGSFGYDGSGNSSCILTLANSGVAASSYGSNLKIPVITVNQKGLLTGVSEQLIPIVDDLSSGGSNKLLSAEQGKNLDLKKLNKTEIRKVFGDTYADVVPAGYDYNNIMPGDYVFHDASAGTLNAPPFAFASVSCEGTSSNSDQRFVIAREYFSGQIATKARQNNNWSGWNVHALKTDNVASATKLKTARKINNIEFDGTTDIVLPGVKAFANFDGMLNIFRKSNGISSIVNQGNGRYLVTLSEAAPDSNYIVQATAAWGSTEAASVNIDYEFFTPTANQFVLRCAYGGDNTRGSFNSKYLNITIYY